MAHDEQRVVRSESVLERLVREWGEGIVAARASRSKDAVIVADQAAKRRLVRALVERIEVGRDEQSGERRVSVVLAVRDGQASPQEALLPKSHISK
jgi:hypothetical protein